MTLHPFKERQPTPEAEITTEVGGTINLEIYLWQVSQAKYRNLDMYLGHSLNISA